MSFQDTINNTIFVIQGCVDLAKNTITATAQGIAYLFTNFPEVLKGVWEIFKVSLNLGHYLMTLGFQGLKYIALNIPEIAKGLYNIAREIFEHLPEVLKFVGYTLPKFFLYEVPKAALRHLPAIANWFVKHLPDLIAHSVGVVVGIIYAPFKITYDFLLGKTSSNAPREGAQRKSDPMAEAALVGIIGAAVVADEFRKEVSDYEARGQRHIAPGYERHMRTQNFSLDSRERQDRVAHPAALSASVKHRS